MNEITKNTLKRILSAIVALPIYIFAIITDMLQALPILIVSLIISITTLYEFFQITDKNESERPFKEIGIAAGILINIIVYLFAYGKVAGYSRYVQAFDAKVIMGLLTLFFVIMLSWQVFKRPLKGAIYSLSTTVFGLIFIVFSTSHIILMKSLYNGVFYVLLLNVVVMINDSGAYFGGVFFGKHNANFEASPNKTWEGYFSGLFFSIIGIIITNSVYDSFFNVHLFSMIEAAILGIFISILANIGDLIESVIKRDGSIKDSGSIIPGHGGMWDVFDALIFTYPIFYYYLILKGVH